MLLLTLSESKEMARLAWSRALGNFEAVLQKLTVASTPKVRGGLKLP